MANNTKKPTKKTVKTTAKKAETTKKVPHLKVHDGADFFAHKHKKPLSMVMKVVEVNGKPATKLSDSKGKTICQDEEYNEYVRKVHNYKSIDDMTVDEIKLMLPAFQDVKLSDIYTPVGA